MYLFFETEDINIFFNTHTILLILLIYLLICRVRNWDVPAHILPVVLKHVIMYTFLAMTMLMQKTYLGNQCVEGSHMMRMVE